jgi:hypothetical protein
MKTAAMNEAWAWTMANCLVKHMRDDGLDALEGLSFALVSESIEALTVLGNCLGDAVAADRPKREAVLLPGQS